MIESFFFWTTSTVKNLYYLKLSKRETFLHYFMNAEAAEKSLIFVLQLNKGLEDHHARVQDEYKSLQEEHVVLKNKVEVEQESQRLQAEV